MNVHPITLEVVRNAFVAYSEEMATALCRSAYNMMIYEVRDFCCGLIDTEGRLISQNSGGLPIFLADLGVAVLNRVKGDTEEIAKVEAFPRLEGRQMVMVIAPK